MDIQPYFQGQCNLIPHININIHDAAKGILTKKTFCSKSQVGVRAINNILPVLLLGVSLLLF